MRSEFPLWSSLYTDIHSNVLLHVWGGARERSEVLVWLSAYDRVRVYVSVSVCMWVCVCVRQCRCVPSAIVVVRVSIYMHVLVEF